MQEPIAFENQAVDSAVSNSDTLNDLSVTVLHNSCRQRKRVDGITHPGWNSLYEFYVNIRRHVRKRLNMTTMTTGGCRSRTASTLPKDLLKESNPMLSPSRKTSETFFGILPRFVKNLLESEILVCSAAQGRKLHWVTSSFGSIISLHIVQSTWHKFFPERLRRELFDSQ